MKNRELKISKSHCLLLVIPKTIYKMINVS